MRYEKEINELVTKELDYAKAKHGNATHNSHHEKYAVILEEWEEVKDEINMFDFDLNNYYWRYIKKDEPKEFILRELKESAMHAIDELIQVVAMIDKGVKE